MYIYIRVCHIARRVGENERKNRNLFTVNVQFSSVTKTEISETKIRVMYHFVRLRYGNVWQKI